jgi:hypothetical protein
MVGLKPFLLAYMGFANGRISAVAFDAEIARRSDIACEALENLTSAG